MVTLARSTIQHIIRMHSQACYMSYQLWHIHISLPWRSQPNRNRVMELSFLHPSFFPLFLLTFPIPLLFPTRFLFPRCLVLSPTSFSLSRCPYLLLYPPQSLSLSVHVSSPFLHPPLSSPFNFSLSPHCSPLTPSSERAIRLHRGFAGWGWEGKPKWNAAHLLE